MDVSMSPSPVVGAWIGNSQAMKTAGMKLLVLLVIFVLSIFLVQMIWNHVIIKKFPNSRIQPLTFWDSLAIAVFVSLLTGGGATMISIRA